MTQLLAIIGGSGFSELPEFELIARHDIETPFGSPSAPVMDGLLNGHRVLVLARHGLTHQFAPHTINYRANLWALHSLGSTQIIAVAAVGGIHGDCSPGKLVLPDQIIDYTWGRECSFFTEQFSADKHIDFSWPYDAQLRNELSNAAQMCELEMRNTGTYGATQGPRLETAAEITRMARDGCDLVGMTGMPEAALARELNVPYACCAVVANYAAGLSDKALSMPEIEQTLAEAMDQVYRLINCYTRSYSAGSEKLSGD